MTPRYAIYGLCALLAILAGLSGVDSCRRSQGHGSEIQSAIHQGEAQTHAQAAESVPDHSQALASAAADSARAWAEVRRLRKIVGTPLPALPDSAVPPQAGGDPAVDLRTQQLLAADRELIDAQDRQIQALTLALTDEQRRSAEFREAYEAERKATAAQAAATKSWKEAVTTSRWRGRIEGFAAGVALGYVGGRR